MYLYILYMYIEFFSLQNLLSALICHMLIPHLLEFFLSKIMYRRWFLDCYILQPSQSLSNSSLLGLVLEMTQAIANWISFLLVLS